MAKKFEEAERKLRELLTSGKYRPGDRFPSEYQLADELGLNRATVGKAVAALIADGLLERAARSRQGTLVRSTGDFSRKQFLFLVTDLYIYASEVLRGFQAAAFEAGCLTTILKPHIDNLEDALSQLPLNMFSGICTNISRHSFPVPCVYFDKNDSPLNYRDEWTVSADVYLGGALIAEHLYRTGRRNFIYVRQQSYGIRGLPERCRGFMDRMRELGVPSPEQREHVLLISSPHTLREALRQMEKKFPGLDAVVCGNDFTALDCRRAARDLGWDTDNILFAGFGNIREVRKCFPLVTVEQHNFEVGQHAFEKLHRILRGGTADEPKHETLPVELIV